MKVFHSAELTKPLKKLVKHLAALPSILEYDTYSNTHICIYIVHHICSGKPWMFSEANPQRQLHTFSALLPSHCACSLRTYNRQVTFQSSSSTELPLPLILSPCHDQGAYFIGLQKYQMSLICTQGRSTKCHAHTSSPFILWVCAHRGMH